MDLMAYVVVFGGLAAIGTAAAAYEVERRARIGRTLRELGLLEVDGAVSVGVVDEVRVEVREVRVGRGSPQFHLTLPALPLDVSFHPETVVTHLASGVFGADLRVGEARFDDVVLVTSGGDRGALALLDAPTRDAILAAVQAGGVFEARRWWAKFAMDRVPTELPTALRAMVAVHRELAARAAEVDRRGVDVALMAMATGDRSPWVRMRVLRALIESNRASDGLLEQLGRDLDGGVALFAVKARGERGRAQLVHLLATASRTWRVRAAVALAELGAGDDLPRVESVLAHALQDRELAVEAAQALGAHGTPAVLPALDGVEGPAAVVAREAARAIRGRLPPDAAGRLAIVPIDQEGRLAVVAQGVAPDRTE